MSEPAMNDRAPVARTPLRRLAVWAAAAVVLLAVFAAYLHPDMAMQVAQQLWSCF
jgi:hypothetical protein